MCVVGMDTADERMRYIYEEEWNAIDHLFLVDMLHLFAGETAVVDSNQNEE